MRHLPLKMVDKYTVVKLLYLSTFFCNMTKPMLCCNGVGRALLKLCSNSVLALKNSLLV